MDVTRDATRPFDTAARSPRPGDGPPAALPPAQGGFELIGEVGRGGMGVVCRALDVALGREVAVKILQEKHAPDSAVARRFVAETRVTGQLQHPGIPAVSQVGTWANGQPYLAMKLIQGRTLDELLKSREAVDVLGVFEGICQTVAFAHAHGVIHRDLKPANVMVGAFGEVQVMDWGLAKVLAVPNRPPATAADDPNATVDATVPARPRPTGAPPTQHGSVLGTPAYMGPEQARGEVAQMDRRTDVFGLGAILCVLLTGQPPYVSESAADTLSMAAKGHLGWAADRLEASGAGLVALCKRCLRYDPSERPESAERVKEGVIDLRRDYRDRVRKAESEQMSTSIRAVERRKSRRVLIAAAAVTLCVLASATVVWFSLTRAAAFDATRQQYDDQVEKRAVVLSNRKAQEYRAEILKNEPAIRLTADSEEANRKLLGVVRDCLAERSVGSAVRSVDDHLSAENTSLDTAYQDKWYAAAQGDALCTAACTPPAPRGAGQVLETARALSSRRVLRRHESRVPCAERQVLRSDQHAPAARRIRGRTEVRPRCAPSPRPAPEN